LLGLVGSGGLLGHRTTRFARRDLARTHARRQTATQTLVTRYSDAATSGDVCVATTFVYMKIDGQWRVFSQHGWNLYSGSLMTARHDGIPGRYAQEGGDGTLTISKTGRRSLGLCRVERWPTRFRCSTLRATVSSLRRASSSTNSLETRRAALRASQ
jgi:hypothetical protein